MTHKYWTIEMPHRLSLTGALAISTPLRLLPFNSSLASQPHTHTHTHTHNHGINTNEGNGGRHKNILWTIHANIISSDPKRASPRWFKTILQIEKQKEDDYNVENERRAGRKKQAVGLVKQRQRHWRERARVLKIC